MVVIHVSLSGYKHTFSLPISYGATSKLLNKFV
jgi:hypothetical protein